MKDKEAHITMMHGAGGTVMHNLVKDYVVRYLGGIAQAEISLEAMDDAARGLYVNYSRPESEFREQVLKEARSMYIPLTEENLHIERGPNDYYVWGDYTVHVNLPLYPLELKFHPASKSQKRRM